MFWKIRDFIKWLARDKSNHAVIKIGSIFIEAHWGIIEINSFRIKRNGEFVFKDIFYWQFNKKPQFLLFH